MPQGLSFSGAKDRRNSNWVSCNGSNQNTGGGLKSAALDRNLTISFKQYKINHLFHLSFSALAMMMKLPHLSSASLVASNDVNDVKLTPMLSIHFCCRLPLALDQ